MEYLEVLLKEMESIPGIKKNDDGDPNTRKG